MDFCDKAVHGIVIEVLCKQYNKERMITMKLRNKKIFSRIAAGVMVAAMAITLLPGTVKNVNAASVTSTTANLKILKRAEVYAPNTTFEFAVTEMTAAEAKTSNGNTDVTPAYQNAPADGASASTVTSTPQASDLNTKVLTKTVTFSLDASKFEGKEPGTYRYKVQQDNKGYEGITYDTDVKYLDVVVGYNGTNTEVLGLFLKDSTGDKIDTIVNRYGIKADPTDPETPTDPDGTVNDLKLVKTVTGAYAEKTKDFSFTIAITGAAGEQYHVVDASGTDKTITSGGSVTVTLKDGQSVMVYGLSANDSYTITEDTYAGYTTSFTTKLNGVDKTGTGFSGTGSTVTNKIAASDELQTQEVTFKNDKDGSATGIILNYAPYALMIVLAAATAFVFFRKRRSADF